MTLMMAKKSPKAAAGHRLGYLAKAKELSHYQEHDESAIGIQRRETPTGRDTFPGFGGSYGLERCRVHRQSQDAVSGNGSISGRGECEAQDELALLR
jgi:hypothetical protein